MKRLQLVAFWLITAALWYACARAGEELALSPRQGVVLLNNGELIAGTITPAGDRYDINLPDGELHLKRSDVSGVFRDTEECYQHKLSMIDENRAQDHLELAEWCLKNNLIPPAEAQLVAARAADATHPRIQLVEARLRIAKDDAKRPPSAVRSDKTAADAQAPLDRMARSLPAGSVENFTNTIQPILLNYCSRAGCHGAQSTNGMRLERVSIRLAGRHPTQRNLQAALALVDTQSPNDSKLLQTPIRAHGPLKAPIFSDREQSQYRQLVQWVYQVSNTKTQAPAPSMSEHGAPLLQTLPGNPAPAEPADADSAPPAKTEAAGADWSSNFPDQPRDSRAAQGARAARTRGQTTPRSASKPDEPSAEMAAKDPFDPEIFNRRFFGP